MFDKPAEKTAKAKTMDDYSWTLDEDMIDTANHQKAAEKLVGAKLTLEGVKNGGMDMIDRYDNQRKVFERDTPDVKGNTWWKPWMTIEKEKRDAEAAAKGEDKPAAKAAAKPKAKAKKDAKKPVVAAV